MKKRNLEKWFLAKKDELIGKDNKFAADIIRMEFVSEILYILRRRKMSINEISKKTNIPKERILSANISLEEMAKLANILDKRLRIVLRRKHKLTENKGGINGSKNKGRGNGHIKT